MSFPELVDHLKRHALRTDGPFTLRSGVVSSWYLDARQTTFDGEGARLVGRAVLDVLVPGVEAVGGMTMGVDPIAVATAMTAAVEGRNLRAFSVREAPKAQAAGRHFADLGIDLAALVDPSELGVET